MDGDVQSNIHYENQREKEKNVCVCVVRIRPPCLSIYS